MKPERIAELRAAYAACTTERARAEHEAHVLLEIRREHEDEREWSRIIHQASEVLGTSIYELRARRQLFTYGDLSEPLWDHVDGDMSIKTAVELVRHARKIRVAPEPTAAVVARVVAEYYARPFVRTQANGKVTRHHAAPGATNGTEKAPRTAAAPAGASGHVFLKIRELCVEYARSRAPDHDADTIDSEVRRLETDLKVALENFADRLQTLRKNAPLRAVLGRRQIVAACQALLIDPPRDIRNVSAAWKAKAKRQFRNLARECHPDTHGGSESLRERYEAVVAAWNFLRDLIESH